MIGGLAALLLVAGLLLWLLSGRALRRTGLPAAEIVAQDTAAREPGRTLVDRTHGLTGRPDYLLRTREGLIPVEVKPTRRAAQPYESDLLQLAAYCLLVEAETGRVPPYGLLVYADHQWRIPFTPARRQQLITTLAAMRADLAAADVARSHQSPARCRGCGLRQACDAALA